MESLETTACFRDDLLDFPSDISDDDVVLSSSPPKRRRAFPLLPPAHHLSPAFSGFVEEEELEWISNKDAFPMVESFVDIMPNHPSISNNNNNGNNNNNTSSSHLSPVSVLDNSSASSSITSAANNFNFGNFSSSNSRRSGGGAAATAISAMISLTGIFKVPGKARSKQLRKRRREMSGEQFQCWGKVKPAGSKAVPKPSSGIGRKCLHCGAEKTPQWRAGPCGPKTLCNACGVRYKSGRLVPEYRPASSPTFSSELHSNSHRKIVEMRKQKMVHGELEVLPPPPLEHVG